MTDLPDAPTPGAILEAAIYAPDLDAAERFYGGLLGLERLMRAGDRHVFYRLGETILLVFNPEETPKPPPEGAPPVPPHGARGEGHVCFAASDAEITAIRARLEAAGVVPERRTNSESARRLVWTVLQELAGRSPFGVVVTECDANDRPWIDILHALGFTTRTRRRFLERTPG